MSAEKNTQTFSFDTVAVLVAVIKDKGGSLGMKDYERMASLDGSRSASGFDHLFRKVKSRANELLEANGAAPATPRKKTPAKAKNGTPATGASTGGKKRGRKEKADADGDDEESPVKKVKEEAEADADEKDALT